MHDVKEMDEVPQEILDMHNEKMIGALKDGSYKLLDWANFIVGNGLFKTTREAIKFICNPDEKLSLMDYLIRMERFEDCKFLSKTEGDLLAFLETAGF